MNFPDNSIHRTKYLLEIQNTKYILYCIRNTIFEIRFVFQIQV